ncbi:hypothetical protein TNCV_2786581 [Trichonephila clavipes]|nr:hypothetical protein TNCV_2786581 [Trichonephila clavipes]
MDVSEELGIAQSINFRLWQQIQDERNVSRSYNTDRARVRTSNEDRCFAVTPKRCRRSTAFNLRRQLSATTGQQAKEAPKLGKLTKTDTMTEEYHSIKCLQVCNCSLCEYGSLRNNMYDTWRRQMTWTVNVEERFRRPFKIIQILAHNILLSCLGCVRQQVHEQEESSFSREGEFNARNSHEWAYNNLHSTRNHAAQHGFAVNMWAEINVTILGPYLLPSLWDGRKYLIFLETVLPTLLDYVPAHICQDM